MIELINLFVGSHGLVSSNFMNFTSFHLISRSLMKNNKAETALFTVDSRVFDVCAPKVMCAIKNACEGIVVGCQHRTKCKVRVPF